MGKIEKEFKERLKLGSSLNAEVSDVEMFEQAVEEFEALVKAGLIKKRGNRLFSISDFHLLPKVSFNGR